MASMAGDKLTTKTCLRHDGAIPWAALNVPHRTPHLGVSIISFELPVILDIRDRPGIWNEQNENVDYKQALSII